MWMRVLMSFLQPVVLGVEDGVHRGEADVLVAAAVTGDEVCVEQLIVVPAGLDRVQRCRWRPGHHRPA